MTTLTKSTLALVALAGVASVAAPSAEAFGGGGGHRGMHRGDRAGHVSLIPEELREDLRVQHQDMTSEERAAHREERRAAREEKRVAFEQFTGLSREELRDVKRSGGTIGDILAENGTTQEEAEAFLTERANDKVNHLVEHHDISSEQEQTIRDRIGEFVQSILNRWFG